MKALKTLLRNQITAVKLSEKQHKGAENCFEVHFSGAPGSPWLLSAASKVTIAYVTHCFMVGYIARRYVQRRSAWFLALILGVWLCMCADAEYTS